MGSGSPLKIWWKFFICSPILEKIGALKKVVVCLAKNEKIHTNTQNLITNMQSQMNENENPNMMARLRIFNERRAHAQMHAAEIPYLGDVYAFLACAVSNLPDGVSNEYLKERMGQFLEDGRQVCWCPPTPGSEFQRQDFAMQIKNTVEQQGLVRKIQVRNSLTNRLRQTFVLTLSGLLLCEQIFDYRFYGPMFHNIVPDNNVFLIDYIRFHNENPNFIDLTQEE